MKTILRSCVIIFAMTIVVCCGLFQAEAQQGEVKIVSRSEWETRFRGRVALGTELQKALNTGVITREEYTEAIMLMPRTDDVAASAAKAFETTQDYNEVLTQLILDRNVVSDQPQTPSDRKPKRVVTPANAPWRIKYRGRIALVIQVRLAFDRGQITQEEMLQTRSLITNLDDGVAGRAAKSFRRNGDFRELMTTLASNQQLVAHDGEIEIERRCNDEAHAFFLGCMYAGGNPNDCGRQSFSFWCGCMGGLILDDDFCYVF
jgi:hypothetical protein